MNERPGGSQKAAVKTDRAEFMFRKILIANRGEIACRVIKTARRMGIGTVAVYSDADRGALHVRMSDEAVRIGPAPATQSYLAIPAILDAARRTGAEAVHPGYGFLSENKEFATALASESIEFIGPPAGAIEAMGDKIESKRIASSAGVSTVPGHAGLIESDEEAVRIAREIGYPVMIKASAGGGGKGMRIAWDDDEARQGYKSSQNEAAGAFGDDRIFIEKFITGPRHIEIQLLADKHGSFVYLNERECSIQRRNQKVIEEAPSPFLDESTRRAMGRQAVQLAQAVGYHSAGTVEFIVDSERKFYFLEMNTRLQVEHPVTELITGIDLVEEMLRVAVGEPLSIRQQDVGINGWAMESRIYAEEPLRGFLPSSGRLTRYRPPAEVATAAKAVRNDTGVFEGGEISVHYDPMIAKLCSWSGSRQDAIEVMRDALDSFELEGISCNIPFLSAVMDHPRFVAGETTTAFIEEEFPDGFTGARHTEDTMRRLAAAAAVMHRFTEIRNARISGRMSHHSRRVGADWIVEFDDRQYALCIAASRDSSDVTFADGAKWRVASDWTPGTPLARLDVGGVQLAVKTEPIPGGFRFRYRGAVLDIRIWTPRQAELAARMPKKMAADTTWQLLCPMPGLIVSIDVAEGDSVEIGQPLCTMEAMKMENVLKAERKARVKSVLPKPGDTLAVDDVIMEFE